MRYMPVEDEIAAEDCFTNYTTPRNYLRSIFFISTYWIILAIVLVAGATNISLFSLGYLIGCFIFLWLGNETYLMPLKRLLLCWNLFIAYAALVIISKIILQYYSCNIDSYFLNHCYILQLLRIVCYSKIDVPSTLPPSEPAAQCAASLPYGELDILWDGLCLACLLMQRIVFGTQYFRYLVQDVKAQQILASRGAELIQATQVEEAKAQALYEREVMGNIRAKMNHLKTDNEETSKAWQRLVALPHHHQIIRNADKHLFIISGQHEESVSRCRTDDWKFKKVFIPDPLGDELERMSEINGITAVFTRWMKGEPLYGSRADQAFGAQQQQQQQQRAQDSSGATNSSGSTSGAESPARAPLDQQQQQLGEPSYQNADSAASSRRGPASSDGQQEGGGRGFWNMLNLLAYSCLLSATVELNKLSRSYRYVSRCMAVEKTALKRHFNLNDERFRRDPGWRHWVISTLSDTYVRSSELDSASGGQRGTSLRRIRSALRAITGAHASAPSNASSQDSQDSPSGTQSPQSPGTESSQQQAAAAKQAAAEPSSAGHSAGCQVVTKVPELADPEYHFLKLNMLTQFFRAIAYVFISNTSLLCQLVIILNQVLTASLLSLPLPLLTFLWGTLSVPRPTKRFWKTVITYTELVIVIKYVCQFPIWQWDTNNINPFYYPNLLGIKNITIVYDLLLLLVLFFHRSMLKSLGQWDASGKSAEQEHEAQNGHQFILTESHSPPTPSRRAQSKHERSPNGKQQVAAAASELAKGATNSGSSDTLKQVKSSEQLGEKAIFMIGGGGGGADEQATSGSRVDEYLENAYQCEDLATQASQTHEVKLDYSNAASSSSDEMNEANGRPRRNCLVRACVRMQRSILSFFQHVLKTPYKVQTDVYTWMFLCDFINFLILIYGFWAFGSGYTNQTVASFLNENRIPFSVLIMLLAQFASIIIDRAFYLQKNIAGKLMFQVVLVIGIHIWLFFALPFTTGHALTLKEYWPPKAWYVFKSIYFLLSAHQIRCGYPRRVLGNCLTKGHGYANWGAFKFYRAIPLVYDLRLYMDWIWTETTLEFRNWSLMEDMFANLFIRKCELTLEEEYPIPRAKPIKHLSKYLTGGAFILLILAIIWGPLLLFSMGKTVGESNPPVEMDYELEIVGFQPILKLRATAQQINMLNEQQYDQMKAKFVSLTSQSFLGDYKLGDVAAILLDGQSNAVWEISPPSKMLLMNRIKNNETITLKSSWTVHRIKSARSQNFDASIAGSYQQVITGNTSQDFRNSLYDMLSNSPTTLTDLTNIKSVVTPAVFPNYIRVPETGQATLVEQFYDNLFEYQPLRSLSLSYIRMFDLNVEQTDNSTSWWRAEDLCKYQADNDSFPFWSPPEASGDSELIHCDSLLVITFNDRIFTGILALLSAPGIIGLYTTFVVFFARLIRTEPSGKVIYTEIPNVDRVYGLIMDIYMARECGEYELEEKLFAKLLFLYRSPEMLIDFSKREDEPQPALLDLDNSGS